jgi:hypothetical protein
VADLLDGRFECRICRYRFRLDKLKLLGGGVVVCKDQRACKDRIAERKRAAKTLRAGGAP